MKKIILYLYLTTLVPLGCNQLNTANNETNRKTKINSYWQIQEVETEQLNSGIRKDTIIEGFIFGMTPNQVINGLNDLKQKHKIDNIKSFGDQISADYTIGLNNYTLVTLMTLRFFKGELYNCQISYVEKPYENIWYKFDNLLELYDQKYIGQEYEDSNYDSKTYYWVNGDRTLKLACRIQKEAVNYRLPNGKSSYEFENCGYLDIEYKDNRMETIKDTLGTKAHQEKIDSLKPKI